MDRHSFLLRILSGALIAALLVGCLSACGKDETPPETEPQTIAESLTEETQAAAPEETGTQAEPSATESEPAEAQTEAPAQTTEKAEKPETTAPAETSEPEKKSPPSTTEEIITLFNDSVNAVKTGAKSVTTNYTLNTQTSDAVLSSKTLQSIANKLISANMGYDKKKDHVTYSGKSSIRDVFPVSGEDWSSKLTVADVSKATCTEKDGIYTVTIYLLPDTTPNIKPGQGHAGKAFSIITKDQIVNGAGSLGMSVIREDSIKLTFKNCRVVAKIDAETGRLKDVNYFMDWTLSLAALGMDVAVSFGAEDDYSVKW